MPTIEIRQAVPDDAAPLATLAEQTFRRAFAAQNTPEDIESYVATNFSPAQVEAELGEEASTFLVADANGSLLGYAKLRDDRAETCVTGPSPVELERLYVHTDAIGQGLGAKLMRACLDWAGDAGFETLWLGVWARNERAIAFYERWHFETVGSHVFRLGSDDQIDLIMQRPVA